MRRLTARLQEHRKMIARQAQYFAFRLRLLSPHHWLSFEEPET